MILLTLTPQQVAFIAEALIPLASSSFNLMTRLKSAAVTGSVTLTSSELISIIDTLSNRQASVTGDFYTATMQAIATQVQAGTQSTEPSDWQTVATALQQRTENKATYEQQLIERGQDFLYRA